MLHPTKEFYHRAYLDCLRGIETWTPVYLKPYNKQFKVSNFGYCQNTKTGHILKIGKYQQVSLAMWRHNISTSSALTNLVYYSFCPSQRNQKIGHKDGNQNNNSLTNLYPKARNRIGNKLGHRKRKRTIKAKVSGANIQKTVPSITEGAKLIHQYLPQFSVRSIRSQIYQQTCSSNTAIINGRFKVQRFQPATRRCPAYPVKITTGAGYDIVNSVTTAANQLRNLYHIQKSSRVVCRQINKAIKTHQALYGRYFTLASPKEWHRVEANVIKIDIWKWLGPRIKVTKIKHSRPKHRLLITLYNRKRHLTRTYPYFYIKKAKKHISIF